MLCKTTTDELISLNVNIQICKKTDSIIFQWDNFLKHNTAIALCLVNLFCCICICSPGQASFLSSLPHKLETHSYACYSAYCSVQASNNSWRSKKNSTETHLASPTFLTSCAGWFNSSEWEKNTVHLPLVIIFHCFPGPNVSSGNVCWNFHNDDEFVNV